MCVQDGDRVGLDRGEAAIYFKCSADQEDGRVQLNYCICHHFVKRLNQVHDGTVKYFRLPADDGDVAAQLKDGIVVHFEKWRRPESHDRSDERILSLSLLTLRNFGTRGQMRQLMAILVVFRIASIDESCQLGIHSAVSSKMTMEYKENSKYD
jgi:hypothetical protein